MKIVLTHDGSRTLLSDRAGQCFHSGSGALTEALHVFLENSGVARRLSEGHRTRVLEIGFGTGLNFLVTADTALAIRAPLEYVGIDTGRITASQFRELGYGGWFGNRQWVNAWAKFLQGRELNFRLDTHVSLELIVDRAESVLADSQRMPDGSFHAIYMDPFSPEATPELWAPDVIRELHRVLMAGGCVASYCVKSTVQQRFRRAGFRVHCPPGPQGGKRQTLTATRS